MWIQSSCKFFHCLEDNIVVLSAYTPSKYKILSHYRIGSKSKLFLDERRNRTILISFVIWAFRSHLVVGPHVGQNLFVCTEGSVDIHHLEACMALAEHSVTCQKSSFHFSSKIGATIRLCNMTTEAIRYPNTNYVWASVSLFYWDSFIGDAEVRRGVFGRRIQPFWQRMNSIMLMKLGICYAWPQADILGVNCSPRRYHIGEQMSKKIEQVLDRLTIEVSEYDVLCTFNV